MTARPRRGPRGRPVRPAGPTARTGDHVPVMLGQVVDLLVPALRAQGPDAVLVDGTLGLAGHAVTLLERAPDALLVGVDRDPEALALAGRRLRDRVPAPASRAVLVQDTYDRLPEALRDVGRDRADAVLLDLGVSSLQVDTAGRGFSYTLDADLDMRMDPRLPRTAAALLASLPEHELAVMLRRLGDEPAAGRIARAVVRARGERPVRTTAELAALVSAAVPAAVRRAPGHPAKRTFQALRVAVNDELALLAAALPRAVDVLAPGGVIVVLSYHSGEDRLVKRALVDAATSTSPLDLPVELPGTEPRLRLLARGLRPGQDEVDANPRAASARLRAAVATGAGPSA